MYQIEYISICFFTSICMITKNVEKLSLSILVLLLLFLFSLFPYEEFLHVYFLIKMVNFIKNILLTCSVLLS